MILQNKKRLILTSLVILLPMAVGLLVWEKLPQVEEGWNPSLFAVFGPSLTMLAARSAFWQPALTAPMTTGTTRFRAWCCGSAPCCPCS